MPKTLVIVGYGTGISTAVAEKFGAEGFSVAIVARNEQHLAAGASALAAKGIAAGAFAGDASDPAAVRAVLAKVRALLAAVQEALPDLKNAGDGAVLVTNGAFGELSEQMDAFAVSMKSMGVALANAAKHKLVGLLAQRLRDDGVYVGEVMVAGMIKGSAWDSGASDAIKASTVADKFWELYKARGATRARVAG
ncbi:MAG: SDR family NAD(P)-dependent oxidoreductase [Roseiarcus sp.]|uniref:SDR family NAD(P)-dependent oxidoreductase n=1 Tax=Roseiarcus sp. TaxID=1969460 RepID=UPI003C26D4A9